MADLALRLKVFLASPSDVRAERDVAERELLDLQKDCAKDRLLIETYRWEKQITPTFGRVQSIINTQLRTAELTIAIFWSTLGTVASLGETGTLEEFRLAGERVTQGYADDVFLYLKTAPPPASADPAKTDGVKRFRDRVTSGDQLFAMTFETTDEFRERISHDLRLWIDRWRGVPDICGYALRMTPGAAPPASILGENRLARLKQRYDPFTALDTLNRVADTALRMYQAHGPLAAELVLEDVPVSSPDTVHLVEAGVITIDQGGIRFEDAEWFYFCCAVGLRRALAKADVSAVERIPFINAIHQYLQALAVGPDRQAIVTTLRRWLLNSGGVTEGKPVARNFAAYVLGMLGAAEAHEYLARVIQEDVGEGVRNYCVASLGRLRARVQLPVLAELFRRTEDPDLRLMTAQAVSRMIGVADYPM